MKELLGTAVGKVTDFAAGLRQTTTSVRDLITERRASIVTQRTKLQHAEWGPRPPEEVIAAFAAWVQATAAYQAKEYGAGLVIHRFGSVAKGSHTGAPWSPGTAVDWGSACMLLGPELTARFADLVRATDYSPGPAAAERPALVEKLRAELEALAAEEEQLVDEAVAAGIGIDHRPEVIQRRQQEARQRELAERAETDRRAREAALNQRHVTQAGVTPSPYLERERTRP